MVYGSILFLSVFLFVLRYFQWLFRYWKADATDPTNWRGVTQLDQEQRAGVIEAFLNDCSSTLEVEDVFGVERADNLGHSSLGSTVPNLQAMPHSADGSVKRLYHG